MTERKPSEMSFPSWIDQQINEAAERGAFDNLPGAGKPIPRTDDIDDGMAWLRDYVRREGVSTEEFLPTPLRLRKAAEQLAVAAPELPSEDAVREAARDLNRRIMDWRLIPVGPPIFVALVDEEELAADWRAGQPANAPADGTAGSEREPDGANPARRRWWRRRS